MLNRLPPLNAVKAFHAVSRHLNLSRAAEELGVTQGAVSKQIIALEDFIGAKLFERTPSGLELTEEGQSLKLTTLNAFDVLMTGFSRFERRPPRSQRIRISTLSSFAAVVLAPRLDKFEASFPDVQLDILTSDRLLDHTREEVDLSIRYGSGDWEHLISQPLGTSDLIAVCHPELDIQSKATRRIQVFSEDVWSKWDAVPGQISLSSGPKLIISDFLITLSAVFNCQGIALLPELILREHVMHRRLRTVGVPLKDWSRQYHIAMTPRAGKRRDVTEIAEWFERELATLQPISG